MPLNEPATFMRLGLGMGLYVVVVVLQSTWLRNVELPLWVHVPLALVPLVPVVLGMLGWGFLEAYAGFPRPSAFLVLPFLAVNYLAVNYLAGNYLAGNYLAGIVRAKERYR